MTTNKFKYDLQEEYMPGISFEDLGKTVREAYVNWVKETQKLPNSKHIQTWEELKINAPTCCDCDIEIGKKLADKIVQAFIDSIKDNL